MNREWDLVELIDELIDGTASTSCRSFQRTGIGQVIVEATRAIGGEDLGAENESGAFIRHNVGGVERSHRVLLVIVGEAPYLVRKLSVFYRQAHRGIPPRW